jgi:hypothetical protein
VDQLPFQNVRVLAQMRASHTARVVAMREAPLNPFSALTQKVLALGTL